MATFARTRLAVVVVVLLVPAMLYPLLGTWTLAWLPVAVGLLGLALARPDVLRQLVLAIVRTLSGKHPEQERADGQDPIPESDSDQAPRGRSDQGDEPDPVPAPRGESGSRGVRLRRTELPSAMADYDFVFSARVHWRWAHRIDLRLRDPAGPASYSILLRARDVLARTRPEDRGLVEVELSALFAEESAIADGMVEVWADDVRVELEDQDAERLRRVVDLRKDRALWEAEHEADVVRATLRGAPAPAASSRRPSSPGADIGEELSGQIIEHVHETVMTGPGSGVDDEGYESYWWPAEHEDDEEAARQDVQVAILRGLIDSVEEGQERTAFVREQVRLLEAKGFGYVAERIQAAYPEH